MARWEKMLDGTYPVIRFTPRLPSVPSVLSSSGRLLGLRFSLPTAAFVLSMIMNLASLTSFVERIL